MRSNHLKTINVYRSYLLKSKQFVPSEFRILYVLQPRTTVSCGSTRRVYVPCIHSSSQVSNGSMSSCYALQLTQSTFAGRWSWHTVQLILWDNVEETLLVNVMRFAS